MRSIAGVLGVVAVALLLVAGAVFGLDDRQVLVAPPEAVAEGFVRKLETERYSLAWEHLSDSQKAKTSVEELRAATERLKEQVGEIQDVRGEPGWMRGDAAEATVVLEISHEKQVPLRFRLTRQQGAWAIDQLGRLEAEPSPDGP